MPAPFAALQTRINAAVFRRLANALATINGAQTDVIFDNGYALGNVGAIGMASTEPTITLPTASVPASPKGKPVVVGGVSYIIATHEPDGAGVSVLGLERVSVP
jgi:hypothetical protein